MSKIREEMQIEKNRVILKGHGKINLALDVVGKRSDSYHEVRMIMQQIQLHDRITVERGDLSGTILLDVSRKDLPTDESNIAYKAAALMQETCGMKRGVIIRIEKNIPMAAGLAGGSADGAAVLVGMNELFQLGLNQDQLCEIGLRLGADVPFCILGGTALAEGIGEVLTPVRGLDAETKIVLCKPPIDVSTKAVYQEYSKRMEEMNRRPKPDIDAFRAALETGSDAWMFNAINVLEYITAEQYPVIQEIGEIMSDYQPKTVLMSGSGPTVFGLFGREQEEDAQAAYEKLRRMFRETYLTAPKNS